jgi:hypothetical protein
MNPHTINPRLAVFRAQSKTLAAALAVGCLLGFNSQSLAQETVIFSDSFAGSSSESLGGKTPTTGSGVWQVPDVDDAIKADGSFSGTGQKWLNWTPSSGFVYELKVTINQTNGDWAGLCFKPVGTPPDGNPIWTGFGSTGVGTMLNVDESWPNVGGIGANGSGTYMIRLDTTAANWKTSYFFNGVQKGSTYTWTTNPAIGGVAIISYDNTAPSTGSFSNFELKSLLPITITYSNGGEGNYEPYSSIVSATDLANVGSSALSSLTQTTGSAIFGSSVSLLNDGIVFDGGDRGDTSKSFTPSDGSQVVIEFNSARKVSEINTFAMSGSGQTRSAQNYKLEYRSGSTWATLFSNLDTGAAGNLDTPNTSTRVNIDFSGRSGGSLANVDALRFTFYNVGGDETLYREIDVNFLPTITYSNGGAGNYETYSSVVSATDIANEGSSALSSLTQTTGSAIYGSSVSLLNDGIVFDGGDRGDTSKSFTPSDGSQVVIEFNSAQSVTEINTFAMSGSGQIRSAQNYKLEYRSDSTWTTLFSGLNTSAAGNLDAGNTSTRVNIDFSGLTGGSLANVDAFRFTFYNVGGDETLYREIDVLAVAVDPYASWAADNAGGQTADLDYDIDGVSNGVEFFMNADLGFTANPGLVGNTVTWPNGGNIDSAAYGSQFEVQTSTDLANWSAVASDDITLSNTAGALTWKVASIANGDMGSFTGNLPSSWVVSGGALTSASSADNSPFTNKFADNGSSWLIDDSTDTSGSAGFLQVFSNKTNYPSVEVNFDFKLTALTGGTWGIQFDGAGAELVTGSSSVHYRIDAAGQFAINAGPGGVITNILALEANKWYNVRATFTTTAVNTGSNNGAGVQSGTITPEGGSPVSWSNVSLLNTSLGFSRLLVRDRSTSFAGDLLLDNVSVAPQGKEFVRLKVTPN